MSVPSTPYYESRFIRANDATSRRAVWLRETLLMPDGVQPSADVWVMVFDPAGNCARKSQYPLDAAEFGYDDWTARIAATSLDDSSAVGSMPDARWDLTISPDGQDPVRVLSDRSYRARFPTAKTQVRHPHARFDGRLQVAGRDVLHRSAAGSNHPRDGAGHDERCNEGHQRKRQRQSARRDDLPLEPFVHTPSVDA